MIKHAQTQTRPLAHVEPVYRLKRLQQAQEVERSVERARLAVRSDDDEDASAESDRANDEPFGAECRELPIQLERRDERRATRRADDYRSAFYFRRARNVVAEQSGQ